jgi:GNAT superfamily N-acetyltransferase
MAQCTLVAGDTRSPADLHAATVAAFSDYLAGPFQMTLEQFPSFIARQGVDLGRSRVALLDGVIGAFAFVAPRAEVGRWRLAVMGALPQARGTGAAPALLDDFIARAGAAGLPEVELECFAENERALRLYRSRGFEVVCGLHGWKSPALAGASRASPPAHIRAVDRAKAFAWQEAADLRIAYLPFPMTARSASAQVRPLTFWQCGDAQLTFSVVDATPVQVHSLIDLDPTLRDAQVLAQALRAAFADVDIVVPPIQRDDLGGDALRRAGFVANGLHQVLMKRAVTAA